MDNWFERNPTKGIITYTFAVAAATWAISTFVLDEKKINLYRAEKDNAETVAETYKAKLSVVEVENAKLRAENERYLTWLVSEPKSFPALEHRISDLEKERSALRAARAATTPPENADAGGRTPIFVPYIFSKQLKLGEAFVDPKTGTTLGIASIDRDYTAQVYLKGPSVKSGQTITGVKPGMTWDVDSAGKSYRLTVEKINWLTDSAEVSIAEQQPGKQ